MSRDIPDARIKVEYALMERWCKKAKAVFGDKDNLTKLLVWRPEAHGGKKKAEYRRLMSREH